MFAVGPKRSDHATKIATAWVQSLADHGELPQSSQELQPRLRQIIQQIISLASEDPEREGGPRPPGGQKPLEASLSEKAGKDRPTQSAKKPRSEKAGKDRPTGKDPPAGKDHPNTRLATQAARACGEELARLGFQRAEALGILHDLFAKKLTPYLEPEQVRGFQTRLGSVFSQVISGFYEQQHRAKLRETVFAPHPQEGSRKHFAEPHLELEKISLAILQGIPESLGIANLEGKILYYQAGSGCETIENQIEGLDHLEDIFPPNEVDQLQTIFNQVIQTRQPQVYEYAVPFDEVGGGRYFQYHISPYAQDSVLVISREITQQKQLEEALRTSETRYRSVVNDQTEFIVRWTPDTIITFVNEAACRLAGMTYEELIGLPAMNVMQIIDPAEEQKILAAIQQLTPENPTTEAQPFIDIRETDQRWIQWKTRGIFDENRQIIEYQTVGNDITDMKRIQDQLQESEARYRSVIDTQSDLIGRFRPDGTITFVNKAAVRLFGIPEEAIIGHNIYEFVPEIGKAIAQGAPAYQDILTPQNTSVKDVMRVTQADGNLRLIETITQAILNEPGEIVEFQTIGRDITEIKKAQEIQEIQNKLLTQLGERLINVQEIERQRIARELHDAVLNELGAMLIAPNERLTPHAVRKNYEKLIQQIRQTINDLLSPMLNFGLYTALEDLYDTLTEQPHVEEILTFDIPFSQFRYDPNIELHLFRIIQQACDNALQHAQAQHVHVFGRIDAEWVDITIEDDGIGFDRSAENELAFLLAHKHIGLISMSERGKLIGADVNITSQPGSGTQVRVFWDVKRHKSSTGELQ